MTDGQHLPAAQWAPDPEHPGMLRYWDGTRWTENRAPVPPPAPATPIAVKAGEANDHRLLLAAAAAIVVGSLMPWATVQTIFGSISKNGIDGDGMFTVGGGGIILVLSVLRKYLAAGIVAVLCAAVAVFDVIDVLTTDGEGIASISVGWGLWLVLAASITTTVLAFRSHRASRAVSVAS